MATGIAAVTSKSEQADQLREQAQALSKEVAQLTAKLAAGQQTLAALQDKRRELAEAAADGKPQKHTSAEIHAQIAEATLPVEVLQNRLAEKRARLHAVRGELDQFNRDIAIEAQQAARRERFDALKKQGGEAAARITATLRVLVEKDLVELDGVRDALLNEFVGGRFSDAINPEVTAARGVIHALEGAFFDGSRLGITRALLKQGWTERGDLKLTIENLTPPQK